MKRLYLILWHVMFVTTHSSALRADSIHMAVDYFTLKEVPFVCYFSCDTYLQTKHTVTTFAKHNIRTSVMRVDNLDRFEQALTQWRVAVGLLLDGSCSNANDVLNMASEVSMLDAVHIWLIILQVEESFINSTEMLVDGTLAALNMSINTDVVVASDQGNRYDLIEVFNFGKIQGNPLEKRILGTWTANTGLSFTLRRFKYYDRWDFHNLTLRAVSVILDKPENFDPSTLADLGFTKGVTVMTKIVAQLLELLKERHNFRFNFTIAGRWIGTPRKNSSLAVTNSLYWREQDISYTCARIFSPWLDWVDIYFPQATQLETKFYYLIPSQGVGNYENQFLTPMSIGVWWATVGACVICIIVLATSALFEKRPWPALYAFFSVFATICQQGRRMILLVVGITSMLLYNYYTSSVVSWLLNSAAPTLATMDALINSDLELIFEEIGYTKSWLDYPGFYYYTGYKNAKEDILRDKKVKYAKRSVGLFQPVARGIELIRSGAYAFHSEPYTAFQVISKTFADRELCDLGSLQMMPPAPVYIMGQKRSPYGQFFIWSLMRLKERGHMSVACARVSGFFPKCSGSTPRALALGQAAPAFAVLAQATLLSLVILCCEIIWYRFQNNKKRERRNITLDNKPQHSNSYQK